ncbi:alpha-galactosidase [Paenibacillus marchantiophytorum]|uniref:Alpha-galactosidase n=1 Tax=Paenibacillus marchantiophytorum TaxID=1619310 RepID=A0ABQ1EXY0_9BACL|nr:alpha-galactosidase [Paenibacillus marchantiophytorum]GFZ91624.1 alpha-galactosidase [Paenibacillus marchantiophytorum]
MIRHDALRDIWVLEGDHISYALGLSEQGTLNHIYFGEKLPRLSDYPEAAKISEYPYTLGSELSEEEYMGWGKAKFTEPSLKVTFHDHVRDLNLTFVDFEIWDNILLFILKDSHYPLEVRLYYKVIADCDLIERYAEIRNLGKTNIGLEQALTGSMYLPRERDYRLTYLTGKWPAETQLDRVMLPDTKVVLESRRGTTSHYANPFFMLDQGGKADEHQGEVFFGALAFSGNWKMVFEKDRFNMLKVSAGVNDFDFAWNLKPQESFHTPKYIVGYVNSGFGEASRNLHKYQRNYVLPEENRGKLRKVLYNSWEATSFDVNEEQQIKLAEIASKMGVELFVMDDGWFGARNSDQAGLGDWVVNSDKFPNGLHGLIRKVNDLGMAFGLWIEPEMVNPDSDLYRSHPDWVYHFPTRDRTPIRNQLVLNLARADVREFIYNAMDRLLSEHPIAFIKWDMNRNLSEPGYPSAAPEEQKEIWVRHAQGVYEIAEKLKRKHPSVILQSCSGGGGRVDMGILQYFDQVWTSDNNDAFDRLRIQEGFSYAYCAKIMESWVTDEVNWVNRRKLSLAYRFHCAMMGNLGIGDNLLKWSDDENQEAKELIHLYKEIRSIIQQGHQYRLLSVRESKLASVMYVSESQDEAVVFAFLHSNNFADELPRIRLQGLDEQSVYQVEGIESPLSGKALLKIGIKVDLKGDFQSAILRIHKVD